MKHLLFTIILISIGTTLLAQTRPEYYNYNRGMEAIQNENPKEALDYFSRDIEENPKNGYSYSWIAWIESNQGEYGKALTAAELAIKYLPKKDDEYITFAYYSRGSIYLALSDTVKAINDFTSAIKGNNNTTKCYKQRAQIYYEMGEYALADADYDKIIELDPGDVTGYLGKGRNANAQKRWDEAIKLCDHAEKLSNEYSSTYVYRAEAYIGQQKWNEATDDLIRAFSIEWSSKAANLITELNESAISLMLSKMKIQAAKSPNNYTWPYLIGCTYEMNENYEKAIEHFKIATSKGVSPTFYFHIASCQEALGDIDEALYNLDQALNMDSTLWEYIAYKADLYKEKGDLRQAIAEWNKILSNVPDYGDGYYKRGICKDFTGDEEGAIEDLSMSLALEPDDSYAYTTRADIYQRLGKSELAAADYRKAIEIADKTKDYDYIFFAYQGLGQDDKAIACLDSVIAKDTTDADNYYNAACLYSRMKSKAKALEYLEKSLEHGYTSFAHMDNDPDLNYLRSMEEFKTLVDRFKKQKTKIPASQESSSTAEHSTARLVTTEVPFTQEDGVYKVKCSINGLPLHFVLDTGASDVSLSIVEATFMMKNGYLDPKDIIGNQRYMDANGDINVGTVINLKNVTFGDLKLNNIRASVVRSQKAPLLLGQSVLGRLGKIEIDNPRRVIKITHKDNGSF